MAAATRSGAGVRALAARLNDAVVSGGRSLTALEAADRELPDRDRPLLKAMLSASIRWHHRFDWQLGELLDRPLKPADRLLGALLRVGLAQIAALRIPDHAAVSATVAAADTLGLARARGLVNAVLRRYLRERDALFERMADNEVARFSHPAWLIDALRRDWPDAFERVLEAGNALPPMWLRVNRRRIDRTDYLERLAAAGLDATADTGPADAVLLEEPCPVDELPGFADGLVSVQDAAAQRVADLMQLAPGQRVLDACAAPGGKTAHMLERCDGLADVLAVDTDAGRLEQVASGLARLGLTATLAAGDATRPDSWAGRRRFERILVDAPCSATGVIRRHPDIKLLRRADDLPRLTVRQGRMLDALWPLLEPGGRLVYVTCSVLRAENLEVVEAFAGRTADAVLPHFGAAEHYQRLPGETNEDGFYYACLDRLAGGN